MNSTACDDDTTDSPAQMAEEKEIAKEITSLRRTLTSESTPLAIRFRALFSLKHHASLQPSSGVQTQTQTQTIAGMAIEAIAAAFSTPSSLLKHELAYCLGQTRNEAAVPYLRARLEDVAEEAICRHEAAEALGALSHTPSLALLRRCRDDPNEDGVVRETCDIAVARLEWELSTRARQLEGKGEAVRSRFVSVLVYVFATLHNRAWGDVIMIDFGCSDFTSIDPAPPLPQSEEKKYTIPELEKSLLDTTAPLFQRYRAMFSLRDLSSPPDLPTAVPAVLALAKGLKDPSALFRHEVAFVFGQLSHPASIPALYDTLQDKAEVGMVRHEAAEALGSLGDEAGVEEMLKRFLHDEESVVRESIVVALDMAEFEKNGEREYALVPDPLEKQGSTVVASA
ncbi:MAG: hypothetical protein M1825_004384 [Sarcosagium campestre]|nr:MAG: hypothetical protein M1825_004384 [Sarcosagium campestre]